jgi:predicted MFS family arabinose efflux permease
MTIGEMISFPFSNAFAMQRAKKGNQGEYMALYTISFSIAHIFGHNAGLHLVDRFGYNTTWLVMGALGAISIGLLFYLKQYLKLKNELFLK